MEQPRKPQLNMRRVVLACAAALVLLVALGAAMYLAFGKHDSVVTWEQLPLDASQSLHVSNGVVSYATESELIEYHVGADGAVSSKLGALPDDWAIGGNTAVVYSGSSVVIRDGSGFSVTGTVGGVRCTEDYVAVLRTGNAGNDSIILCDAKTGVTLDTLDYSASKVVSFGFYTDFDRCILWVIDVTTDSAHAVTNVKLYDYNAGGTLTYFAPFYDQTIEKVYITESSVFLIGTQDVVRYAYGGSKEAYRVRIYGNRVTDIAYANGYAYLLLRPRGELYARSTLRLLMVAEGDSALDSIMTLHTPDAIVGAFLQNGGIRILTGSKLYSYSYVGKSLLELELGRTPTAAYELDDTRFLLVADGKCWLCGVK